MFGEESGELAAEEGWAWTLGSDQCCTKGGVSSSYHPPDDLPGHFLSASGYSGIQQVLIWFIQ